jgi:formylglycine-generating enzyme required for sulfatase activity
MNARRRIVGLLIGLLAGAACSKDAPARPQWEVILATDAPVPQFGEEIVVEVLDGTSPPPAHYLDASIASEWPLSFGVVPANPDVPVRIHARFFRLATTGDNGLPASPAIIDAVADLPPPSGVTQVVLPLMMKCFGVLADVGGRKSCDPTTGSLAPEPTLTVAPEGGALPQPGSWAPATTVDCRGEIPNGMACVPGGAFILGNPTFPRGEEYGRHPAVQDPTPEHVVELHPYALDVAEMTVGTIRNLVREHASLLAPPIQRGPDPNAADGLCTYLGADDASDDAMPVNCLDWSSASAACTLLGKRLATEAEWEFAARNRTEQTPYPWGTDSNACSYAIVGAGQYLSGGATNCESPSNGFAAGPVAGGAAGDRTRLGIENMGGNLTEWVLDLYNAYSSPCWNTGLLLVDPMCKTDYTGRHSVHSARGGSWFEVPNSTLGYFRSYWPAADATIGLRCALSR